jgi:hypothetical protein
MKFPKEVTIGDKYRPAMEIIDQDEADKYFEDLVEHTMSFGEVRQEAERIERINLGYFAGYYDSETRARVEKLFNCAHPVFGSIEKNRPPKPIEAIEAGVKLAQEGS